MGGFGFFVSKEVTDVMVSASGGAAGLRMDDLGPGGFRIGEKFEGGDVSWSGGTGGVRRRAADLGGGGRRGRGLDDDAACLSPFPCQKEELHQTQCTKARIYPWHKMYYTHVYKYAYTCIYMHIHV